MKIGDRLGQIYFLGMHPKRQASIAEALSHTAPTSYASPWRIYSRLTQPGIIAIRTVTRASGLDIFLLDDARYGGIEDVAEVMFYAVDDGSSDLFGALQTDASLFVTFVRLNWDTLNSRKLWADYGLEQPPKSRVLRSFRAVLKQAAASGMLGRHPVCLHIGGGIGDCDALIVGTTDKMLGLNTFLSTLSQMGTDGLALKLGAEETRIGVSYPIVAESVTELGVGWDLFAEALQSARGALDAGAGQTMHPQEKATRVKVGRVLRGELQPTVFLRRSRSSLAGVTEQIRKVLPERWTMQNILGEADVLLRHHEAGGASTAPLHLEDLICLSARLDQRAVDQPSFPRRHSMVVNFDELHPSSENFAALDRASILGEPTLAVGMREMPYEPSSTQQAKMNLAKCAAYLTTIQDLRLREELRIIERMVERCTILQRQADLPAETRRVSQLGLRRIARSLDQLLSRHDGDEGRIALRYSLVNSGAHLERTISHLSRGNVPMLLATPMQARAVDHFASETMLAKALAAPASAVASRMATVLERIRPAQGEPPLQWVNLIETLEDMIEPIIYTSHGLDFTLARPLGIIHVPRWIMWYPTSSSLILHEVGHAVFSDGQLDDLLLACVDRVRETPAVRAWCEEVAQRGEMVRRADGTSAGVARQWRSDQHEVAAELFNRLFSYPGGAAEAYLFDQLEYFHAIINRSEEVERISFTTRALTVHVAHALLLRSREQQSLWKLSAEELAVWIREAIEAFRSLLREWLGSPPPPFATMAPAESRELVQEVQTLAGTLALHCDEAPTESLRDFNTSVGRSVQRAVFMALAAHSREEVPPENNGTLLAHLVWEAIILCSQEQDKSDGGTDQRLFAQALEKLRGAEVPDFTCAWPERLPRMLHHSIRRSSHTSVLLQQRVALSLYLADWMSLRHSQ